MYVILECLSCVLLALLGSSLVFGICTALILAGAGAKAFRESLRSFVS
jgi:hypothetical protein